MGISKRAESRLQKFREASEALVYSPAHVFNDRQNAPLAEAGFDGFAGSICESHYKEGGRRSIPQGMHFLMPLVEYTEGISARRGVAWLCPDSLSLRKIQGVSLPGNTPNHSCLTRISNQLTASVNQQAFKFTLRIAAEKKRPKGAVVAVDSTTPEANATVRTVVRKDNGNDWKAYLKKLATDEGVEITNVEDLRWYDLQRRRQQKKKVTNEEWQADSDPVANIGRMKDVRAHLNSKAGHVVDLEYEVVIEAEVLHGEAADTQAVIGNLVAAQAKLDRCFDDMESADAACGRNQEVMAEKGGHSKEVLKCCVEPDIRSYIPERPGGDPTWTDIEGQTKPAFHANRTRMQHWKGKSPQKRRSELVERGFAHLCETGGARKVWLKDLEKVRKRHLISVAAHKLGLVMRFLFGFSKSRPYSAGPGLAVLCHLVITMLAAAPRRLGKYTEFLYHRSVDRFISTKSRLTVVKIPAFSTGCKVTIRTNTSDPRGLNRRERPGNHTRVSMKQSIYPRVRNFGVCLLLFASFGCTPDGSSFNAEPLELASSAELQDVWIEQPTTESVILLRNRSNRHQEILSLSTGCDCAIASVSPSNLNPGEIAEVRIQITGAPPQVTRELRLLGLRCRTAESTQGFELSYHRRAMVALSQMKMDELRTITPGSTLHLQVPIDPAIYEIVSANCGDSRFLVTNTGIDRSSKESGAGMDFSIPESTPGGSNAILLNLVGKSDHGLHYAQLTIPIEVDVPASLTPNFVQIDTTATREVSTKLFVASDLTVQSISIEQPIDIVSLESENMTRGQWLLTWKAVRSASPGLLTTSCILRINVAGHAPIRIRIPVSVYVPIMQKD
jgi:transposase